MTDSAILETIKKTRALVAEAAMTGFNCKDGDWAERLFSNQAELTAALKKGVESAPLDEDRLVLVRVGETESWYVSLKYVKSHGAESLGRNIQAMLQNALRAEQLGRVDS